MYKKVICVAVCSLMLAACTSQKTASNADEALAKQGRDRMEASGSPEGSNSATTRYTFKLDKVIASGSAVSSPKASGSGKGTPNLGSGSSHLGTAVIEERGGVVKVTLQMEKEASSTAAMPAHIHLGSCPTPGEVKYALTNVVNGKSETTLPAGVTIATLKAAGPLAINIHKSATELSKYVACGNVNFTTHGNGDGSENENDNENASGSPRASKSPRASESPRSSQTPRASRSPAASAE